MMVFEYRELPQSLVEELGTKVFELRYIPVSLRGTIVVESGDIVVWGQYLTLPDPEEIPGIQRISKIEKIPMVRSTNDFVRKVYL